ncbi:MAG: YceI family protein [Flavobacteriaceae bacterium]|nr:YceI family protein [Bacteroidota bacterium]MDT8415395.1 YceI family protein [Flavobacteriaceae bacterium]
MKKNLFKGALIALVTVAAVAFNDVEKKEVILEKSKVTWKGYKVTGSHYGTVALKSGNFIFDGDKLTGGTFVVDLTTLESQDLSGEYKAKLEGHLKSPDFFGVESHPEATLEITKATPNGKNAYNVEANLTIKGQAKPISFPLSVYGSKATATLKIDRTEYGLRYGSASFIDNIGDKAIYDEFDLVVDVEF